MKDLKKRGTLLILSLLVLTVAILVLAFAWYTKMNTISGLDFDVAQWEFNANQQADDFLVNVFKYANVTDQKAAPGTSGYVKVELSALNSDTDVGYYLYVSKDSMDPEFQKRLFFYTDKECTKEFDYSALRPMSENTVSSGTIPRGKKIDAIFYWKWIYEYPEPEPGSPKPKYDQTYNKEIFKTRPPYPVANPEESEAALYNASCDYEEEYPEKYQELAQDYTDFAAAYEVWLTEYKAARAAAAGDESAYAQALAAWETANAELENSQAYKNWLAASEAWDEFDTKVGKDPEAMSSLMNAAVHVVATEQKPDMVNESGESAK